MPKIVVSEFLTLDGVMQGPGDPDEDRGGGVDRGGWQLPYCDEAYGEYVAGCRVQDGVLGEIEQDRHSMAFTATDHDEVGVVLLCDAYDLGLYVAGVHDPLGTFQPEVGGELRDALVGAIDEFTFDLHGRQQRLAHGFDRHVFDDVQHDDVCATADCNVFRTLCDLLAVFSQVDAQQYFFVFGHCVLRARG